MKREQIGLMEARLLKVGDLLTYGSSVRDEVVKVGDVPALGGGIVVETRAGYVYGIPGHRLVEVAR